MAKERKAFEENFEDTIQEDGFAPTSKKEDKQYDGVVEIHRNVTNLWAWRLKNKEGDVIAVSPIGVKSKKKCEAVITGIVMGMEVDFKTTGN